MSDIRVIADSIVSMRDGAIVGVFDSQPLDYEGAVNAMLGKRISELALDRVDPAAAVLQLKDLRLRSDSPPLSMQLHKNEVVAITGLVGSGKTALAECLFGLRQAHAGGMRLAGAEFKPRSASDAIRKQVFLCAKDRSSNGVVADFSIVRNISLPFLERFSSLGFIRTKREQAQARQLIEDMGVVCQNSTDNIMTLSGGNQQKVMVARWLSQPCELLILDEPFQGVDIQARRDIAAILRQTAHSRATVVFVSEIDEALEIADRILVMYEHTIVGEHKNHTLDIDLLLAQVAGARAAKKVASVA
jgi:simple sugar transport system ATP-binding protein